MKEFMSKKTNEVFGEEYELESMERILGGARKYTYLAKCTKWIQVHNLSVGQEYKEQIHFQEQYFDSEIVM